MLVLTRKAGECVCIGDEIEVRIVSVRGQKVRIAIEAPKAVAVRRKELEPQELDRLRMTKDETKDESPSRAASRAVPRDAERSAGRAQDRRRAAS